MNLRFDEIGDKIKATFNVVEDENGKRLTIKLNNFDFNWDTDEDSHPSKTKKQEINRANQVWVSDITYIGNRANPSYLALITDAYSKKIVGYDTSNSLNVAGSLRALDMALKNENTNLKPLIHHSDRGLQYCANDYQKLLTQNNITPSMTEQYDPYENAIAEKS